MWKVFFGIEADDVRLLLCLLLLLHNLTALCVGSRPGVNRTQSMKTAGRTYRVYRQGRAPPPHIIGELVTQLKFSSSFEP